jgi:hypothetical protein
MASRNRAWDGTAAEKRVRKWAAAEDGPTAAYRRAHVWYDGDAASNFGSYKLLIADVIDGDLKVVPRGLMAAGAVMDGARGGVDLPDRDRPRVRSHLARYYRKLGEEPPWQRST